MDPMTPIRKVVWMKMLLVALRGGGGGGGK